MATDLVISSLISSRDNDYTMITNEYATLCRFSPAPVDFVNAMISNLFIYTGESI